MSYKAKGVLSLTDMELTEVTKDGIFTHDIREALKRFDGQEVTFKVSVVEEVKPKSAEGATG